MASLLRFNFGRTTIINLVTREKLEYIAKKVLMYPLHDAEKDYFLTYVMKIITDSTLSAELVFKGGTAIYHCYLDQLRFSEDLDFTSLNKKLKIIDLRNLFKKYEIFEIKKEFTSDTTLKIEKLKYNGILETPNNIKVEVDKLQNVYLKPVKMKYHNVWDMEFEVNVMDPIEICAEKIRACNDRFRYRDYYDLYMLVNVYGVNISESIEIISKKEIRKRIDKNNILINLDYAFEEVSTKSDTVYYKKEVKSKDLKDFFKGLELPNYNPNI